MPLSSSQPPRNSTFLYLVAACALLVTGTANAADELQRGSLTVTTTPDSAQVILDDTPDAEKEKTPYTNQNMIPGPHRIKLVSANPAHKPANYKFQVEPNGITGLDHYFSYRSKSFDSEHLSISPWRMEFDLGWRYLRKTGAFSGSTSLDPTATPDASTMEAVDYDPDSIPSTTEIPLGFRLGLPYGVEAHFLYPLAWMTGPDGKSATSGFSDARMGLKWTFLPANTGIDLTWRFANGLDSNLGANCSGLAISAMTSQNFKNFDVFGQIGYEVRNSDVDNSRLDHGDKLNVYLRPGYLVGDMFLPYLGARANIGFASQDGKDALADDGYLITLEPGAILDIGPDFSAELGIPLLLAGKNTEKGWGLHVSVAYGLTFRSATKLSGGGAPAAGSSNYEFIPLQDPVKAESFVLFDEHEATNAEYREFTDKTSREHPNDPGFPGMENYFTNPLYADFPVVNISLDDARAFAKWRGKRLPTIKEWKREFGSAVPTGAAIVCGKDSPESALVGERIAGTVHGVGNVSEWVEPDRKMEGTAYHAGGFYGLPMDRCSTPDRTIDISAPSGAKYIGLRLVSDIK